MPYWKKKLLQLRDILANSLGSYHNGPFNQDIRAATSPTDLVAQLHDIAYGEYEKQGINPYFIWNKADLEYIRGQLKNFDGNPGQTLGLLTFATKAALQPHKSMRRPPFQYDDTYHQRNELVPVPDNPNPNLPSKPKKYGHFYSHQFDQLNAAGYGRTISYTFGEGQPIYHVYLPPYTSLGSVYENNLDTYYLNNIKNTFQPGTEQGESSTPGISSDASSGVYLVRNRNLYTGRKRPILSNHRPAIKRLKT